MEATHFALWLQGYVELNGTAPNEQQWQIIKDHLQKVFDKQTPNRDNGVQQPTQGPSPKPYPLPNPLPSIGVPSFDWSKWKELRPEHLRPIC